METFELIKKLKTYFEFDGEEVKFKKHQLSKEAQIFPFDTKMQKELGEKLSSDFKDFNGVMGEVFRFVEGKTFPKELLKTKNFKKELKNIVLDKVIEITRIDEEGSEKIILEDKLRSIICSFFFQGDDLRKLSFKSMPYLNWKQSHPGMKKLSSFIIQLFIQNHCEDSFKTCEQNQIHPLQDLFNKSLPVLNDDKGDTTGIKYLLANKDLVESFKRDLALISTDNKVFVQNINLLIKHYVYLYFSELTLELNSFFKENITKSLFFTLEHESYTQTRKAYKGGWLKLENKINNLFSHAICIDFLNHIPSFKGVCTYKELNDRFNYLDEFEQKQVMENIEDLLTHYISSIGNLREKKWVDFEEYCVLKGLSFNNETSLETAVLKLFHAIDFQFNFSLRKKPYLAYSNWFKEFCQVNYLKSRGRNGRSLNLDAEMLLFLTRLAVGGKTKIRLKALWEEFSCRGVEFDDGSKQAAIEFFEKINLIEKKSDSGDAQYIKAIL